MMERQSRYVIDASVLVDFELSGILETLREVDGEFLISDFAIHELINPSIERVVGLGIRIMEFSGSEVRNLIEMGLRYRALSVPDRAHLILAQREGAGILSNDRQLRVAANQLKIEVHGTLWVLDQMVVSGKIDRKTAAKALRALLSQGSRFPSTECQIFLDRWES